MELINATRMVGGYTLGLDPDGGERLVVAVKGTFALPAADGAEPLLAPEQLPLVMADQFEGEPGLSAPAYESDFAPFKPRCDVLVQGSAYAPGGKPAARVEVSLRVGGLRKAFAVVGDRTWRKRLGGLRPSEPEPFLKLPLTYARAYGGVDVHPEDEKKRRTYLENPVGVGFRPVSPRDAVAGQPLPNTEELQAPVVKVNGGYRPMGFGPIGRNWAPRYRLAGTYDQEWQDDKFPFLPDDFSPFYFQSAPVDQQIDHPRGGEEVVLTNLTPDGKRRFRLPRLSVPIEFTDADYRRDETEAVLDTIYLQPDIDRLQLVWRASRPVRRGLLEIRAVVVGRMPPNWYRARELGKAYNPLRGGLPATVAAGEPSGRAAGGGE